jgi:hypothetical protein
MALWVTKCTASPLTPVFTSTPSPVITHPISKRCYLLWYTEPEFSVRKTACRSSWCFRRTSSRVFELVVGESVHEISGICLCTIWWQCAQVHMTSHCVWDTFNALTYYAAEVSFLRDTVVYRTYQEPNNWRGTTCILPHI